MPIRRIMNADALNRQWEAFTQFVLEGSNYSMPDNIAEKYKNTIIDQLETMQTSARRDFIAFYKSLLAINHDQNSANSDKYDKFCELMGPVLDRYLSLPESAKINFVEFTKKLFVYYSEQEEVENELNVMTTLIGTFVSLHEEDELVSDFIHFINQNNVMQAHHLSALLTATSTNELQADYNAVLQIEQQHRLDNLDDIFQEQQEQQEHVEGLRNQTAHDKDTEDSIQDAIDKLRKTYSQENRFNSIEQLIKYLQNKVELLVQNNYLKKEDQQVIAANFRNILALTDDEDDKSRSKIFDLLKLAVYALEDEEAVKIMSGTQTAVSRDDMNRRFAGWLDSAIIDSQLAYRRDAGLSGYPSEQELNKDKSCFGGSINRIIASLNLIHPDVHIISGQAAKHNVDYYKMAHEQTVMQIKRFGQGVEFQNAAKQYLQTVPLQQLTTTLRALKQFASQEEDDDINNNKVLKTFKAEFTLYIMNIAKTSLTIKNSSQDKMIAQELEAFIDAYITYNLLTDIKEIKKTTPLKTQAQPLLFGSNLNKLPNNTSPRTQVFDDNTLSPRVARTLLFNAIPTQKTQKKKRKKKKTQT